MGKRRVKMDFPPDLVPRPIIWEMGHRFQVVTNIRRADVGESHGWVILELEGDDHEIERSIRWASDLGVRVGSVEGDIIAG
ncbi:MAG: NIL domain-containing protein [Chloroflexi bacterium]|nr:NIL domain-containing protein [Chloroflexota bacterium]